MNLRQRLDEIRTLAEKATLGPFLIADCKSILALLEVVEQQHRALEDLVELYLMTFAASACVDDLAEIVKARAVISLMDREES